MNPIKKQARIAGALYALVAVLGPLSLIYIPGKLFVTADAAAVADRIRSSESLLRLGIGSELLYQTLEVFLVLVFYGVFKAVNKPLARQMVVLGCLPIPIVLLNVLNETAALTLVGKGHYLAAFDSAQLGALASLCMLLHSQGLQIAAIFWGLWLFPLGLLIVRCGFIPRALGVLAMIAGVGYLIASVTSLVLPQYAGTVGGAAGILELGEPPIIVWLLVWGARSQGAGFAKAPAHR